MNAKKPHKIDQEVFGKKYPGIWKREERHIGSLEGTRVALVTALAGMPPLPKAGRPIPPYPWRPEPGRPDPGGCLVQDGRGQRGKHGYRDVDPHYQDIRLSG